MLSRVTIRGLGPHVDTTISLDPYGVTDVVGDSESGKSTLLDSICWVLWGVRADGRPMPQQAIRGDCKRAEVHLELASGTVLTRTLSLGGSPARAITKAGGTARVTSEAAWQEAIGALGSRPDTLRAVLAPLVWVGMASGPGNGRPLRDLLASVLLVEDLDDAIRASFPGLTDDDPRSLKEAEASRAEANRAAQAAEGEHRGAQGALAAIKAQAPEEPTRGQLDAARKVVAEDDAWRGYELASADQRAWRSYQERVRLLGPEPEAATKPDDVPEGLVTWLAAADGRRTILKNLMAEVSACEGDPEQWDDNARDAGIELRRVLKSGDACPTCRRPWGEDHQSHRASLQARYDDLVSTAKAEMAAAAPAHLRLVDNAIAALDHAEAQARVEQAWNHRQTWLERRDLLGEAPPAPSRVVDEPPYPRPGARAVEQARATLEGAKTAAGRVDEHRRQVEAAEARVGAAKVASQAAQDRARRAEELVAALRKAPSIALGSSLRAFSDASQGVLTVRLEGDGVEVLIDGRPWWLASAGRLRFADLTFRALLRDSVGLPWLLLVVDQAQDWSGAWPDVAPALFLWTRPGALAAVVRGEEAA